MEWLQDSRVNGALNQASEGIDGEDEELGR
jgi:hypothetical protein